mmetsp:Transcript_75772/g.220048  ORF Transcript_75772/g.220048 Transcript_75772/m.220048 type:complete len:254 (-) Transcript_75772:1306-2067(-)
MRPPLPTTTSKPRSARSIRSLSADNMLPTPPAAVLWTLPPSGVMQRLRQARSCVDLILWNSLAKAADKSATSISTDDNLSSAVPRRASCALMWLNCERRPGSSNEATELDALGAESRAWCCSNVVIRLNASSTSRRIGDASASAMPAAFRAATPSTSARRASQAPPRTAEVSDASCNACSKSSTFSLRAAYSKTAASLCEPAAFSSRARTRPGNGSRALCAASIASSFACTARKASTSDARLDVASCTSASKR